MMMLFAARRSVFSPSRWLRPALVAAAATVASLPAAQAQEAPGGWGLGVMAGFGKKAYRDFDDKAMALPLITYENNWVSLMGPRLDFKLPPVGDLSFRLRLQYSGDGYEADDSPYFNGLEERKSSVWAGGAVQWKNPVANLSAELLGDVSGKSKGATFKLQADHRFQIGATDITPRVALIGLDGKYVDYYYGVRANEARADRAAYGGEHTFNVEAGLRLGHVLAQRHIVFVDMSVTRLGSSITDSPLVDRSTEGGVRLGYLYRF